MRFALIGNPISHSLSPSLFKAAYPGSENSYELLQASTVDEAVRLFKEGGYTGVNVTAPFKESVLKYSDKRDSLVMKIGASNLLINDSGTITAYNTDFYGVAESLRNYVSPGDRTLVLGCGGAGRAAALAAVSIGCEVTITNRTLDRAKDFADNHGLGFIPIENIADELFRSKVIINTIPYSISVLENLDYCGKVVFEANYLSPQLLHLCKNSNAKYISGKTWLLYQAVQSFLLFTGTLPDLDSMQFMINNI